MSLNEMPASERTHIGFFGMCNAGKSSLVNAVTGQDLSIVSDEPGTTTDPVRRTMEILPLGPVVIVDAPGINDKSMVGAQRVARARRALATCDIAVLVVDAVRGVQPADRELAAEVARASVPLVVAWNKIDLLAERACFHAVAGVGDVREGEGFPEATAQVFVSARTGEGVNELKETVARCSCETRQEKRLIADLVGPGQTAVLVVPIDTSAPKGRLILPQQMVLRDLLDAHAVALVCQPQELSDTLGSLVAPPSLVVTDSQAFEEVARIVPKNVPLTSFSILMARYKGGLAAYVEGAARLSTLADGDRVLVSEGCTHHRQCEDIGTVKMPRWIRAFSAAEPAFEFTSGASFPDSLKGYALVVHCGGCMLGAKEMDSRQRLARDTGVPIVNYGIAIACMHGILPRALDPFPEAPLYSPS